MYNKLVQAISSYRGTPEGRIWKHINTHKKNLLKFLDIENDRNLPTIGIEKRFGSSGSYCSIKNIIQLHPEILEIKPEDITVPMAIHDPILFTLCHELQHYKQTKEGRLIISPYEGRILWITSGGAAVYNTHVLHSNIYDPEYYRNLPWEKEANLVARRFIRYYYNIRDDANGEQ